MIPVLPTTVVGSCSVPQWLERLKTDYDHNRARIPGVQIPVTVKSFYYDYYDTVVSEPLPTKFSFAGPFSLSRRIQNKAYSTVADLVRAFAHVLNTEARVLAAVEATIAARIHQTLDTFPADKLIINPDCGLRHLPAHVARSKLAAMVEGTMAVRATLPTGAQTPPAGQTS
jgi:methionine synthase II (cobalamin-independent)